MTEATEHPDASQDHPTTLILSETSKLAALVEASGIRTIRYGSVVLEATEVDPEQRRKNLELTHRALEGLGGLFDEPGLVLERRKDVPIFYAAHGFPGLIVRELNGVKELGTFERDKFVVETPAAFEE